MAKMYPFDVPWRSKACREKSAEVIVPKTRVSMGKDRIAQCKSKWLLPLRLFCSQMSERSFPTHHDRTESDNRVGVTLVRGMAENNLPHIVRWESAKPPYAEPLVRWCGRSVNVKVGGKCLSMISIYLLPDRVRALGFGLWALGFGLWALTRIGHETVMRKHALEWIRPFLAMA